MNKITDFKPDPHNANRGTPRGESALEASIQELGLGRSIVVDRHGTVIAGNKTWQTAAAAGVAKVHVVETTGDTLVVVRRTDMDLAKDPRARKLAIADNRISQINLDFDAEALLADRDLTGPLDSIGLTDAEIDALAESAREHGVDTSAEPADIRRLGDRKKQIKVVLYAESLAFFEGAIRATGLKNRGEAISEVCRFYIETTRQLDAGSEGQAPPTGPGEGAASGGA